MSIDYDLAFIPLRIAILKIDDGRRENDAAGDALVKRLRQAGHELADRDRVLEDPNAVAERVRRWITDPDIDCVISSGATGLTARDIVPEVFAQLWEREIPGFGELFRSLSLSSVGTSALQSRACAGVAGGTCLFAVPGSPGGAVDAWDGILASQLDSRHRPCSLIDLMPAARLRKPRNAVVDSRV
jgi:molybdenum cofactor biosynthesis protein B